MTLSALGQGKAENGSAAGRDSRGTPGTKSSWLLYPHVPTLGGDGLAEAPGAQGGDTLAPVAPVEQSAGAKGQD